MKPTCFGANTFLTFRLAKRYTEEHELVAFDDETGLGVVSITVHAQESLGDVVFVELPAVGSNVSKGSKCPFFLQRKRIANALLPFAAQIGAVESVKAASDIVKNHPLPSDQLLMIVVYLYSMRQCQARSLR